MEVKLCLHEAGAAPTTAMYIGGQERPTVVVSRGRVAGVAPALKDNWRGGVPNLKAGLGGAVGPKVSSSKGVLPQEVLRSVEASAPPQVEVGKTVPLVVKLRNEVAAGNLAVTTNIGDVIDIILQASGGLVVEDSVDGKLTVTAVGTPTLMFRIVGKAIGPGEITVLAFQRGQGVGSISVSIETVAHALAASWAAATVELDVPTIRQPDLQLLVLETMSTGKITIRLTAADPTLGLNYDPFTFTFQADPRTFFDAFYADIEDILTSSANAQQKIQRLGTKGTYLFEKLVPSDARTKLWALRDRIHTVHVQSEEPWVPWELIKLFGDDGSGSTVERGFLCDEYEVTRWVPGLRYRCNLTMSEIALVVPADSGLAASKAERSAMLELQTPQLQITPIEAEEIAVRNALAEGKFDTIHFTGHGVAGATTADRAEIRLEDDSRLRPEDLTGVVGNLGKKSPIVFLNACEIGRPGMGLTQPGGWPRGFLAAGAGAFIGPFWKINDGLAAHFASSFYRAMLKGSTVGAATREARKSIQAASDPTWLAYSVYAHSEARLTGIKLPAQP
ncbi:MULTISPECIES: CHAT domain-containing protein [unclassified Bradyrhizobium]|uniref:CHAT domain-containing protein n=1 Tax=unclassified Bradyrhizobium TaxID=2631580 RepID=UPI0028E72BBD|nr:MULTISPECIES: CHAT domain-containing protein [unclassified Bradyrhizobium]